MDRKMEERRKVDEEKRIEVLYLIMASENLASG
jgi:hypothetical protein